VTLYRSDISWNGYYTPKVASEGSITLKVIVRQAGKRVAARV